MDLIEQLKDFLQKNSLDGIIVNSTNEYLVEYNMLEQNSRYYLTGFTGSTGDVLFTQDKIYLFVDPRYHEQADFQVNHEKIEVVKIPMGKSYLAALTEYIPAYFKLGIIATKTSKRFYESLEKNLSAKNSTIRLFNFDPIQEQKKDKIKPINFEIFKVPDDIAGISADTKFETIKKYAGEKFSILTTALEDIAYLTNLRSYSFDYSAIFPAKAIITEKGVTIYSDCNLPFIGVNFKQLPSCDFENDLKSIDKQILFIDETHLTIHDYNLINQNNRLLASQLHLFKTIKNENEIFHLKKCFERSDEALKTVYEMINSETIYSEYDYYEALVNALKDNGALSLSFKPIVAAGANSSIIHYSSPSKEKMVNNGDLLLVDFGGYYEGGYATDTTRTFIKGDASHEQKIAYTSVLKAQLNAYLNFYKKKSSYFDIDKTARDIIEKSAPQDCVFSHSTGHGVGICVHENPPIVSSSSVSKIKISENVVFTIEPGVYKENWGGIRLENTVYPTWEEDKFVLHSFSKFPYEIKLVDLSMLNDTEKYYYIKWQANSCIQ